MPDPDFSVNDVRLCVGKCRGTTGHLCSPWAWREKWRESSGLSKLENWFGGSSSVQLVDPEASLASRSQLSSLT